MATEWAPGSLADLDSYTQLTTSIVPGLESVPRFDVCENRKGTGQTPFHLKL